MKYKEVMYLNKYGYDFCYWDGFIICKFRYDPIPHTSGKTWYLQRYHRCPQTTQEYRWSFAHKKYSRTKRKHVLILDPFGEGPIRSDHRDNNWKSSTKRKHQYK
jgi:hypothetical protein